MSERNCKTTEADPQAEDPQEQPSEHLLSSPSTSLPEPPAGVETSKLGSDTEEKRTVSEPCLREVKRHLRASKIPILLGGTGARPKYSRLTNEVVKEAESQKVEKPRLTQKEEEGIYTGHHLTHQVSVDLPVEIPLSNSPEDKETSSTTEEFAIGSAEDITTRRQSQRNTSCLAEAGGDTQRQETR